MTAGLRNSNSVVTKNVTTTRTTTEIASAFPNTRTTLLTGNRRTVATAAIPTATTGNTRRRPHP
ncbi:hypothetical protein [Streptomyces hydrogenans]|uniref:hypothetical protein n=1 Tax=Streptomyces hydrogenans TaxID=1873719 RepID=UPI00380CDE79